MKLQVFLTPPGSHNIADQLDPIDLGMTPPAPARYLLAFWNTFPAYTPLTALRRWDGAHTGPLGGRHGLWNLLRTARSAASPLILLDMNYPAALSALEFAGELELIKELQAERLLNSPADGD